MSAWPVNYTAYGSIYVFADSYSTNSSSQIALTVRNRLSPGRNTQVATIKLSVASISSPLVTITTSAISLTNINSRKQLLIQGTINTSIPCLASWFVSGNLKLQSTLTKIALTDSVIRIFPGILSPATLLLPTDVIPERSSLLLGLRCGVAFSTVLVTTNGAPAPGIFTISPRNGTELADSFSLLAMQWTDEDLPLSYQFGFYDSSDSLLVVRGRSALPYTQASLPAGLAIERYFIKCIVEVYDSLHSLNSASDLVSVSPFSSSNVLNVVLQSLVSHSNL